VITVDEAARMVLATASPVVPVECALAEAHGRVLRQEVRADRPAPPFDRVMMDGIAIRFDDWRDGRREFAVQACVPAGVSPPAGLPRCAIEVMTGGVLPPGCDAVLPVEWIERHGDTVRITSADPRAGELKRGSFIHACGVDGDAGRIVLGEGQRLGPCELAVAATEGAVTLRVNRVPRVCIVTTGDEIVAADAKPLPWQIRGSHAVALAALLTEHGEVEFAAHHAPDDDDALRDALGKALDGVDAVLVTGGVSRGRWDRVPALLGDAGVEKRFHTVAQRPGKPLWFGTRGSTVVFGLPGNPLAVFACARRYVVPWLDHFRGTGGPVPRRVRCAGTIRGDATMTTFHPVVVRGESAELLSPRNSGDLHALAGSDGLLECPPADGDAIQPNALFSFYGWRAS
jgi:molybdopterin molybdotransferase